MNEWKKMSLLDLVRDQKLPFRQALYGGWWLRVYDKTCSTHRDGLSTHRYTVLIAREDWCELQSSSSFYNENRVSGWHIHDTCGCWNKDDRISPDWYLTIPMRDVHTFTGYNTSIKNLLSCHGEKLCPFIDNSDLSAQVKQDQQGTFHCRYVFCHDDYFFENALGRLEQFKWPVAHSPLPPTVRDHFSFCLYLGSIALFPSDLNMMILEYMLSSDQLNTFVW